MPLNYAPTPPQWRKWIRRAAWTGLLLIAGFATWLWGPRAWQKAKILYWQRQCMNYIAPVDQIVYEENPETVLLLEADPNYRIGRWSDATNSSITPAIRYAYRDASVLKNLLVLTTSYSRLDPVVFLHERRTPSGKPRLIYIEHRPSSLQLVEGIRVDASLFIPASATTQLIPVDHDGNGWGGWQARAPLRVRIFAGQPDPGNPSHFTIRYQMWGQEDVIDGWLGDDDRVTLKPRKLPEAPSVQH